MNKSAKDNLWSNFTTKPKARKVEEIVKKYATSICFISLCSSPIQISCIHPINISLIKWRFPSHYETCIRWSPFYRKHNKATCITLAFHITLKKTIWDCYNCSSTVITLMFNWFKPGSAIGYKLFVGKLVMRLNYGCYHSWKCNECHKDRASVLFVFYQWAGILSSGEDSGVVLSPALFTCCLILINCYIAYRKSLSISSGTL